jgi:hypothetical protein
MGAGGALVTRSSWDFEYLPLAKTQVAPGSEVDFVVATAVDVRAEDIAQALRIAGADVRVETLLARAPLFWSRVRVEPPQSSDAIARALSVAGIQVRYATSSAAASVALAPQPDFSATRRAEPRDWAGRAARSRPEERTPGRWFLDRMGVDVDRSVCGTGAGVRLAVIDDEAREVDALDLDAEVAVGISTPSRGSSHGAAMVAWAVGSRGRSAAGVPQFAGVAPDASPRLYYIPKPGQEVLWLPLAIIRAVDDGADVIVCATYVEGTTSPLLDDAFEFATRLGRRGLGTAIVLPTGREISSPEGSVHASLTLGLAEPASDPRVLCVAPSGNDGGWFIWTDKFGRKKPFANRGPAVRIAAPGDDMAYPFAKDDRLGHAESSGASAVASGVALLVLATNADLTVDELYGLLTDTARACEAEPEGPFADSADLLPGGRDADGHNAKCGYGRASASRACLSAADPIASTLVTMGEESAAHCVLALRSSPGTFATAYSPPLARWSARVLRADSALSHAAKVLVRHLRLVADRVDRYQAHTPGGFARALALLLTRLATHAAPPLVSAELRSLQRRAVHATQSPEAAEKLESACFAFACDIWGSHPVAQPRTGENRHQGILPVGGVERSA